LNRSHQAILFSAGVAGWLDITLSGFFLYSLISSFSLNKGWVFLLGLLVPISFAFFGIYSFSVNGQVRKLPFRVAVLILSAICHILTGTFSDGQFALFSFTLVCWGIAISNLLSAQLPAQVLGLTRRSTRTQPLPSSDLP
jgi:hypothetical protein